MSKSDVSPPLSADRSPTLNLGQPKEFEYMMDHESADGLFLVVIYSRKLPAGAITMHDPRLRLAQLLQESADHILKGVEHVKST
jgi:hypothetical protein